MPTLFAGPPFTQYRNNTWDISASSRLRVDWDRQRFYVMEFNRQHLTDLVEHVTDTDVNCRIVNCLSDMRMISSRVEVVVYDCTDHAGIMIGRLKLVLEIREQLQERYERISGFRFGA